MDIGILEMKRQFCPLNTRRRKAPTENGCIENEVASKLFGILGNRPSQISVPPKDLIGFVLFFICECPENEKMSGKNRSARILYLRQSKLHLPKEML